jgi:hypothetical protein
MPNIVENIDEKKIWGKDYCCGNFVMWKGRHGAFT